MKKYNVYYYRYEFDVGYYESEHLDTIYLSESDTMMDGLKQVTFDHDLYNILDECGNDVWELTSEHTKDFYQIVPKGKYQ